MKICVSVYRHVYTPTHCSETGKDESKCTHLLKSGRIMDGFFPSNFSPSILSYSHYKKNVT